MGSENEPSVGSRTPYVLNRLREDCRHTVTGAAIDGDIGHPGVKGRFRELLLNNLFAPWLPAAVGCGTGVVVDHEQRVMQAAQDDIILFDSLLAPSVLASSNSSHGVYLFDNVLCRVEVKSVLTKNDFVSFAHKSKAISELKVTAPLYPAPEVFGAFNMLVAFDSEVARGQELAYLQHALEQEGLDPVGGVVSSMCIAKRGFWLLASHDDGTRGWKQLRINQEDDPLAYFVGVLSNSCFNQRATRLGIKPLGGGIGNYLDHPFDWVIDGGPGGGSSTAV